jgi:DNA polymerase III alpha subunit
MKGDSVSASEYEDQTEAQLLRLQNNLLAIGKLEARRYIEEFIGKPIATVRSVLGQPGSGQDVITGGLITELREVKTKKGKNPGQKMCILSISDDGVSIGVTVFPDYYQQIKSSLKEGLLCCVYGKINTYQSKQGLIANKIQVIHE